MSEIEKKRQELEKKLNQTKEKYFNEKNMRVMRELDKEEKEIELKLKYLNLGVELAQKEFLEFLRDMKINCMSGQHYFNKIIDKERELKKAVKE